MTIDWNTTALIATVLATAITLGAMIRNNIRRTAQMELKLDIIWTYLLERGIASMITNGLATMNSPIVISDEAVSWFDDLKSDLKRIYNKNKLAKDTQLAFEIQKELGDRLFKEICIPHRVNNGECISIALAVAKS